MEKYTTKKAGFTLIELLVVIAIIGLISSIILASLATARQKAQNARSIAEAHQLEIALLIYADSNNGTFPNPLGSANSYYCVGAPTCTFGSLTISNQLAVNEQSRPFLGTILGATIAEAAVFNASVTAQFINLTNPLVYYCATASCTQGNAYVFRKAVNGISTVWSGVVVGGSGATASLASS